MTTNNQNHIAEVAEMLLTIATNYSSCKILSVKVGPGPLDLVNKMHMVSDNDLDTGYEEALKLYSEYSPDVLDAIRDVYEKEVQDRIDAEILNEMDAYEDDIGEAA